MCICPYNATHRFSKSDIGEHIKTCCTRKIVEGSYIQRKYIGDFNKLHNRICNVVTIIYVNLTSINKK